MATQFTNRDGGTLLEAPVLRLRIGKGMFRDGDLTTARVAVQNRSEAVFMATTRARVLHFVVSSFKAGTPWSPVFAAIEVETAGIHKVGRNEV